MNYQDFTYNFMNGEVLAMNNVLDPMAERFLRYLRVERNDSPIQS